MAVARDDVASRDAAVQLDNAVALHDLVDLRVLTDLDTAPPGMIDERGIQVGAAERPRVRAITRQRQADLSSAGRDNDGFGHELGASSNERRLVDTELLEETQRVGGKPVTAGFVARKTRLVEADDA